MKYLLLTLCISLIGCVESENCVETDRILRTECRATEFYTVCEPVYAMRCE